MPNNNGTKEVFQFNQLPEVKVTPTLSSAKNSYSSYGWHSATYTLQGTKEEPITTVEVISSHKKGAPPRIIITTTNPGVLQGLPSNQSASLVAGVEQYLNRYLHRNWGYESLGELSAVETAKREAVINGLKDLQKLKNYERELSSIIPPENSNKTNWLGQMGSSLKYFFKKQAAQILLKLKVLAIIREIRKENHLIITGTPEGGLSNEGALGNLTYDALRFAQKFEFNEKITQNDQLDFSTIPAGKKVVWDSSIHTHSTPAELTEVMQVIHYNCSHKKIEKLSTTKDHLTRANRFERLNAVANEKMEGFRSFADHLAASKKEEQPEEYSFAKILVQKSDNKQHYVKLENQTFIIKQIDFPEENKLFQIMTSNVDNENQVYYFKSDNLNIDNVDIDNAKVTELFEDDKIDVSQKSNYISLTSNPKSLLGTNPAEMSLKEFLHQKSLEMKGFRVQNPELKYSLSQSDNPSQNKQTSLEDMLKLLDLSKAHIYWFDRVKIRLKVLWDNKANFIEPFRRIRSWVTSRVDKWAEEYAEGHIKDSGIRELIKEKDLNPEQIAKINHAIEQFDFSNLIENFIEAKKDPTYAEDPGTIKQRIATTLTNSINSITDLNIKLDSKNSTVEKIYQKYQELTSQLEDIENSRTNIKKILTNKGLMNDGQTLDQFINNHLKDNNLVYALPDHKTRKTEWHNPINRVADFVEEFAGGFYDISEKNPIFGTLAAAAYGFGGLAILSPALLKTFLVKANLTGLEKGIAPTEKFSSYLAKGGHSQAIAAGFGYWKLIMAAGKFDELVTFLIEQLSDDPVQIALVLAMAYGIGYGLCSTTYLPFKAELGSFPHYGRFIAGIKGGAAIADMARHPGKDFLSSAVIWVLKIVTRVAKFILLDPIIECSIYGWSVKNFANAWKKSGLRLVKDVRKAASGLIDILTVSLPRILLMIPGFFFGTVPHGIVNVISKVFSIIGNPALIAEPLKNYSTRSLNTLAISNFRKSPFWDKGGLAIIPAMLIDGTFLLLRTAITVLQVATRGIAGVLSLGFYATDLVMNPGKYGVKIYDQVTGNGLNSEQGKNIKNFITQYVGFGWFFRGLAKFTVELYHFINLNMFSVIKDGFMAVFDVGHNFNHEFIKPKKHQENSNVADLSANLEKAKEPAGEAKTKPNKSEIEQISANDEIIKGKSENQEEKQKSQASVTTKLSNNPCAFTRDVSAAILGSNSEVRQEFISKVTPKL